MSFKYVGLKEILITISLLGYPADSLAGPKQNTCDQKNNNLEKLVWSCSPEAEKLAFTLQKKGFDCGMRTATSERGYRCRGRLGDYPEPINIYIPSQYDGKAESLALHLHGHSTCGSPECHFNLKNGDGDYGKFLSNASTKTLLIMPESHGKVESFLNYFKSPAELDRFMSHIQNITGVSEYKNLYLSSHSGSDKLISRFAQWELNGQKSQTLGKIQRLALFDSLYAQRESIPKWITNLKNENRKFVFLGSYVIGPEASTDKHMLWLERQAPASDRVRYLKIKTSHMAIMKAGGMEDFLKDVE